MQKVILFSFFFLLLVKGAAAQDFKVVGYLPSWKSANYLDKVEWGRITHLNIAFANPDANGQLQTEGYDIAPIVAAAHRHGVKAFISVAGGFLYPDWKAAWQFRMEPAQRNAFISGIVQYVIDHDLDGVDVDLEWSDVKETYSPFVIALRAALAAKNLQMTAALPGGYRYPQISKEALDAFDWINLMIYDKTGPWDPNNPGPHAPYDWTLQCLDYWQRQGLSPERMTLGVPFYGYDFGVLPVKSFTFHQIVNMNPAFAQVDVVDKLFYNGIPTIQQKTALAMSQLSGIMIWELAQDAFFPYEHLSLLKAIDEVVHMRTAIDSDRAIAVRIFPNPVADVLNIRGADWQEVTAEVLDVQGKIIFRRSLEADTALSLAGLPAGMYFLRLQWQQKIWVGKFSKM